MSSASLSAAKPGEEELGRMTEALQLNFADPLELEVLASHLNNRPGHEHLACRCASGNAGRKVDLTAELIAIAEDDFAAVDPDPWQRPFGVERLKADRPIDQ